MVRNNFYLQSPCQFQWVSFEAERKILSKPHAFVIDKSCLCLGAQEKKSGLEFLRLLITLQSFPPIFLCVCPKCLISVTEAIMLATIQNSSSSNIFRLRYWSVYTCSSQSLGGAGWKLLAEIFYCWRKSFLFFGFFSESDSVGATKFQGRLGKENKFSVRNVYLFLLTSHWLWPFGSSWWVESIGTVEKISRIQVLRGAFYQTTTRLKIRKLLFYK